MYAKLKVLLLLAEFPFWRAARHLSYSVQLGIEDGLHANEVQCLTVTSPWLPKVLELWGTRKFDQVEYRVSPTLKNRKRIVERRLQYMTHALACDEKDVAQINAEGKASAIWWPQAVPARFISETGGSPSQNCGVFCGACYGVRREWLRRPDLKPVLTRSKSPETGTMYPFLFNALHLPFIRPFRFALPIKEQHLARYLSRLRYIRERCFEGWLKGLQTGCAVVNLPHLVKTYAGRVVEGMAAGRPVISWEIPGRPLNKALFEDEGEILLYPENDPHQLASHLKRILTDRELSL
ncbi:MAG: hypothetical protein DMG12_00915 [Acidobacteria bacterium]|nr:MAG: hypothetical protein DMG12_00915 [Acidobacteriota bacterium]